MQYLLTKEEYDALRDAARVERRKALDEVLLALEHEFSRICVTRLGFSEDWMVRLPEMDAAIKRTRNRFK